MANNTNKNLSLHFPEKQTADLISHYKKLETNLKNLLDKTPLAVDAAITAFEKGVCGAAVCLGLHATAIGICSVFPVPEPFKVTRGVWLIKPTDAGVVIAVDTGVTGNALDERFKREGRCSKQDAGWACFWGYVRDGYSPTTCGCNHDCCCLCACGRCNL